METPSRKGVQTLAPASLGCLSLERFLPATHRLHLLGITGISLAVAGWAKGNRSSKLGEGWVGLGRRRMCGSRAAPPLCGYIATGTRTHDTCTEKRAALRSTRHRPEQTSHAASSPWPNHSSRPPGRGRLCPFTWHGRGREGASPRGVSGAPKEAPSPTLPGHPPATAPPPPAADQKDQPDHRLWEEPGEWEVAVVPELPGRRLLQRGTGRLAWRPSGHRHLPFPHWIRCPPARRAGGWPSLLVTLRRLPGSPA